MFAGGSAAGATDAQLLARYAADGDGAAFEVLVARHGPMVVATCRAILRDEHDVEDAFQATFLVLARKAGSVRGETLGGWLHRVACSAAVRLSVQRQRRRKLDAEALAMSTPAVDPTRNEVDLLRPILHDEVDRLERRVRQAHPEILRVISHAEPLAER